MREVRLIVLYEGWRDRKFIQAYLKQGGYKGSVQYEACAKEYKDGGEKTVRGRYAAEVAYIRNYVAKNSSATRWLLVHIDADVRTVAERYKQLNDLLPREKRRSDKDPVCTLVPKRNTETWVYHLTRADKAVTEVEDYKYKVSDDDVTAAGRLLAENDPSINPNCPPSLIAGHDELKRLPF